MPGEPLPPKENSLFKRMLKYYELKQYKFALKLIKQILSNPKCNEHGETLCMKAMILNAQLGTNKNVNADKQRDEAIALAKDGLRSSPKSHVCWHVYGVLMQAARKYEQAVSAFRQARRNDPNNLQILRDLSTVLIHTRDFSGYLDLRYDLIMLRPGIKASWLSYAVALHLSGRPIDAYNILQESLTVFPSNRQNPIDPEQSEVLHYMADLLVESGDRAAGEAEAADKRAAHANGPLASHAPLTDETRRHYTEALKFVEQHEQRMHDQFAMLVR